MNLISDGESSDSDVIVVDKPECECRYYVTMYNVHGHLLVLCVLKL